MAEAAGFKPAVMALEATAFSHLATPLRICHYLRLWSRAQS